MAGFYNQKPVYTREQIQDFWNDTSLEAKREIRDFALFQPKEHTKIENPTLNRRVKVNLILTAGNMNLVVPQSLLNGSFAESQDEYGCVLSKKTADALFSTHGVLGEEVLLNKKTYQVRGILDSKDELGLIQGPGNSKYSNMRVSAPGIPLSVVKQQLSALFMDEPDSVSEGQLYAGVGGIFLWIPAWICLVCLLKYTWKEVKVLSAKEWEHPWQNIAAYLLRYGVIMLGFLGVCAILLLSLHFSDDYIPSAWSDFSSWTELIREKWRDFMTLMTESVTYADRKMLKNLIGLVSTSLAESVMLVLSIGLQKNLFNDGNRDACFGLQCVFPELAAFPFTRSNRSFCSGCHEKP